MQVTVKRMYAPQQPLHFDFSGGGSTTVATLLNKIHDRLGWCLADLRLLRGGSNVQLSHVIGTDIPAGTEFVLVLIASWRKRAVDKGIKMGKNNETFSSVSSMNDYQQEVEKHRKRFVEKQEAERPGLEFGPCSSGGGVHNIYDHVRWICCMSSVVPSTCNRSSTYCQKCRLCKSCLADGVKCPSYRNSLGGLHHS